MNELLGWYGYDSVDRNELAVHCASRSNGSHHPVAGHGSANPAPSYASMSDHMATVLSAASSSRISIGRSAIENQRTSAFPITSGVTVAIQNANTPAIQSTSCSPAASASAQTMRSLTSTAKNSCVPKPPSTADRCTNNTDVSSPESSSHQSHSPLPRTPAALCVGTAGAALGMNALNYAYR